MTPKEKAKELVSIFGKKLAIKAVDYILNETRPDEGFIYWQEVKQEIPIVHTSAISIKKIN